MDGSGVQIHPLPTLLCEAGDELENGIGSVNAYSALVFRMIFIGFIHPGIFSTCDSAWSRMGAQNIFSE